MAAVQDSFEAPNNATLERFYQITSGGAPQDITGWLLHAQWRYADGSLALDLTLANRLFRLVDAPTGQFKKLVDPADLLGLDAGELTFDILAIPPRLPGDPPRVYRPFFGTVLLTDGSTIGSAS